MENLMQPFKFTTEVKQPSPSPRRVYEFSGPNNATIYLTYDDLVEEWTAELELETAIFPLGEKAVQKLIALLPKEPVVEPKDLNSWLEDVEVMLPGTWENPTGPKDWYAVCNTEGIFAYFAEGGDAFRHRIDYINRKMNP